MQRQDDLKPGVNNKVKRKDLEALQVELLEYMADEINRLLKLTLNDDIQKKLIALLYFKEQINKTTSIMDLIELANEMLVHPDFTKNRITHFNITTVEKKIILFLHVIYDKFSVSNAINKKTEVGFSGILPFTDQNQITNVLNNYIKIYALDNKNCVFPKFNERQMVISQDNVAVMFELDVSISHKNIINNEDVVGKAIILGLINSSAYLLAQNIHPERLPEKLRLCIGINHTQSHWTGLVVNIEGFLKLYREMYKEKEKEKENEMDLETDERIDDHVLAGRQHDYIYKVLGMKSKNATYSEMLKAISGKFSITMNHYDSMNCASYYSQVINSIIQLSRAVDVKRFQNNCSQQKGNTCGDHTTFNLVGIGLYGVLPVINQEALSSVTSNTLRTLTNEVHQSNVSDNHVNIEMTKDILIEAIHNQKKRINDVISDEYPHNNYTAEKLNRIINLYVERLYQLAPEQATALLDVIRKANGDTVSAIEMSLKKALDQFKPNPLIPSMFESYATNNFDELQDRVLTLAGIVQNTNNKAKEFIFKELDIPDEDCVPYCEASKMFLQIKQSEIEERVLIAKYGLEDQITAMNNYQIKK